jgi:hypothetical protein
MSTLMQASRQWATRPADERYTSLTTLRDAMAEVRRASKAAVVSSRALELRPSPGDEVKGLDVVGHNGGGAHLTHWSFGQLATLAGAPAGYMRTLAAPIAADCLNYGLKFNRDVAEVGVLWQRGNAAAGELKPTVRAATGPNYGRIWNAEIADMLVDRFGDGVNGHWRVPGEFGQRVEVSKANTTLFASDRDMFVFLADEDRRIEVPNRRNGQSGSLARGFFVWNSEVGSKSIGAAFFLFDYVCCNRIVWGAENFKEIRLRHTSGAPDRWLENVVPVLEDYSAASAAPVMAAIEDARKRRVEVDVADFLANRFGSQKVAQTIMATHEAEEGRPIQTQWDVVTGATAYARTITNQDARVEVERTAGKLLAA